MKPSRHLFQLLFVGSVTLGVAVWGSPTQALAAAAICKVLAAIAGTTFPQTNSKRSAGTGTTDDR